MKIARNIMIYSLLILSAVVILFPIFYSLMVSFMPGGEVLHGHLFPEHWSFTNYKLAFQKVPLLNYLLNSFLVSFIVMIGQLIVSSLAAFAFVFISFKGRQLLFYLFISTMMIPWEATMIPNFITVTKLGWVNTFTGLTVPFFALAFGTFLLRQNFKTIPKELNEATQIAGMNRFQFFVRVVLPVSKTSLVSLGAYGFLTTWNMYLWPLLVTNNDKVRTIQIGLKEMQSQEVATQWGVVMAAVIIVILPTLILLFAGQKQLQKGLIDGALK